MVLKTFWHALSMQTFRAIEYKCVKWL
jgi:hypothetical protein